MKRTAPMLRDALRWGGEVSLGPAAVAEVGALLALADALRPYMVDTTGGNLWRVHKALAEVDRLAGRSSDDWNPPATRQTFASNGGNR